MRDSYERSVIEDYFSRIPNLHPLTGKPNPSHKLIAAPRLLKELDQWLQSTAAVRGLIPFPSLSHFEPVRLGAGSALGPPLSAGEKR